MATRYRFGENHIPHFVTFAVVNWIDALSRPTAKDILVESLKFSIENKGLLLHAWVLMNNHVHLIISTKDNMKPEDIMRDIKKFTATQIIKEIDKPEESRRNWMMWLFKEAGRKNSNNTYYQFWQQDNHPIALPSQDIALQKLAYIHQNPVRAGIVYEPEHYIYSSAIDYRTEKSGLLPIERLI